MDKESLTHAVSLAATVSTIGLFSSGILTCRKIHQAKSVGVYPHIPFVAAATNCSLWLTYGYLKPDNTIIFVNAVGLFLQLIYVLIYHTYSENKYYVRRDFLSALTVCTVIILIHLFMMNNYVKTISQLGLICNFFTIVFFASPLSTVSEVVRTQTTESMSLPLSVMSSATTLSWTVYGVLVSDIYVQFPNFMGLLLSIVQLSLFALYPAKRKTLTISESLA